MDYHRKVKWTILLFISASLLCGCIDQGKTADKSIEAFEVEANKEDVEDETKKEVIKVESEILPITQDKHQEALDTRGFLDVKQFQKGISEDIYTGEINYTPLKGLLKEDIIGGIIPHHSVANVMIADFYREVSQCNNYDLIVLISPNHASLGGRFQVSDFDYLTYQGIVETDHELVVELLQSDVIESVEKKVIEKEHGQLVHMSYIQHFFPETKVVSLIVSELRKEDGIYELVDKLWPYFENRKVLFVASIDFSHYLTLDEANTKDIYTKGLIENNDSLHMIGLSNDHIDSPSTYMLFINLLGKKQMSSPIILNHSNSALFLKNPRLQETTSYFQVVYTLEAN